MNKSKEKTSDEIFSSIRRYCHDNRWQAFNLMNVLRDARAQGVTAEELGNFVKEECEAEVLRTIVNDIMICPEHIGDWLSIGVDIANCIQFVAGDYRKKPWQFLQKMHNVPLYYIVDALDRYLIIDYDECVAQRIAETHDRNSLELFLAKLVDLIGYNERTCLTMINAIGGTMTAEDAAKFVDFNKITECISKDWVTKIIGPLNL